MTLQYLFDENVASAYVTQIRRRQLNLFVLLVGEPTAPIRGTLDPNILDWCEQHRFILVTNNRKSMPQHLADHLEQGRHVPGIFILNSKQSIGENIDELILIAEVSSDEEYQDRISHLPLS